MHSIYFISPPLPLLCLFCSFSDLISSLHIHVAQAEEFFQGMGIGVVMGHRYLGGFIRDMEAEERWLGDKITGWADSVETLARVSHKHPQSAYVGLQ